MIPRVSPHRIGIILCAHAMAANDISPQRAAITCAENVAVLDLLQPTTSLPFSNILAEHQKEETNYTLPLGRENSLAGILAFLAHIKDGPNIIPAVCIEEDHRAECLRVHLAVNKASESDNNGLLDYLKEGFDDLFALLANARGG